MFLNLSTKKTSPGMLFQLMAVNIGVVTLLVAVSSYLIYTTACFLVDQMPTVQDERQVVFENQLAVFLWWTTPAVILLGIFFLYFFTKKLMRPLHELVDTTASLKSGEYPAQITATSFREVDQLTHHMNELNSRLKKNEEARTKMLTDMAHELRTPLSNINGYMEAMKDGVIEGNQPLFHSLHKESARLINMIDQLQEMSKWNEQTSQTLLEKKWTDVKPLLTECLTMFQLKITHEDIPLNVKVEPAILYINDEGIRQAVSNLFQNAVQYYEGSQAIELRGRLHGDVYEICVQNPGPPLPEEEREWLFERFYRADSSRSRKTGGSGLGLAIVKEIIVNHHEGKVTVSSEDNIHSFKLIIPVKP
ncbi:HAMP domain-containing histidine kinase [Salipaludibacillus sp. CUR1]|uniref:sensor histidine kinase n=1 Tax=Salipaludibacillus sp. CUR1 TaxID=2820003 RepID=UPI001E55B42F|nr:HAMP domain-containing sensor histidine kinase [Salipaludibacillus sp. CUR1]MCE7793956.1 HAMP domain-containing histidine kinase [Salipaludibacillus sp. CUR1]